MKKYKKYILIVVSILIIFITVFIIKIYSKNKDILLITTDKNLNINFYNYDGHETLDRILSFKKSTYHTGIEIGNKLFLNKKDNEKFTQLYEYDKSSKQEKQITDKNKFKIVNVDYMCKGKDKVFIRVLRDGHRNFNLASYDLNKKTINVYNEEDKDKSVHLFDYCEDTGTGIELVFSSKEYYENIKQANENQTDLKNVQYSILYSKDCFESNVEIGNISSKIVTSIDLSNKENKFIFTAKDSSESPTSIFEYNMNENTITELFNGDEHIDLEKINNAKYSKDGKKIYFTATKTNKEYQIDYNGDEYKPNSLMSYDLMDKTIDTKLDLGSDTINYIN